LSLFGFVAVAGTGFPRAADRLTNSVFKNSWKPLKIFSPKEILAEEIKNLILKKKNLNEKNEVKSYC